MGERDNALAQGEIVPYTAVVGLEDELAEVSNKREIDRRSSNGITVIAYWLMKEQVVTIFVHDARINGSTEFEVAPDRVKDAFEHPFADPNCNLRTYNQSENDE